MLYYNMIKYNIKSYFKDTHKDIFSFISKLISMQKTERATVYIYDCKIMREKEKERERERVSKR